MHVPSLPDGQNHDRDVHHYREGRGQDVRYLADLAVVRGGHA